MDWIDELVFKFKKKMLDISLKRAMATYLLIAIGAVLILFAVSTAVGEKWSTLLSIRYFGNTYGITTNLVWTEVKMTLPDQILTFAVIFLQSFSIVVYSIGAVIVTSYLFYKNKLAEPIELLKRQVKHIGDNELGYECVYEGKDELGEVCSAFEQMRITLIENNKRMWNMMEEQRRLNAAFAHDLRTPLTVIHGYADFLSKYYPTGKITEEQMMENFDLINAQAMRLMNFTNTMKEVGSLEALELNRKNITGETLFKRTSGIAQIMEEMGEIKVTCESALPTDSDWFLDEMIFMEILENMLSNAMRYAKSKVVITLESGEDYGELYLYVQDDGEGFSKEGLKMADRPYYSDQKGKDDGTHYGIGLFICKFLCEKHGGSLDLANSIDGGAIICAIFGVK